MYVQADFLLDEHFAAQISCRSAERWTESPRDKTNKMACAPSEDSDQPGHPTGLIRVFAVHMKKAWVLSYSMNAQRRLIRLGGCPGWSESSLGAQSFWEEYARKRICNDCSVQIEYSVTWDNCSASLVMPNSYPCDWIFNPNVTTIKDSYILS